MTRTDLAGVPRTPTALRRTAFLAGALYGVTFLSSIPAVALSGPDHAVVTSVATPVEAVAR